MTTPSLSMMCGEPSASWLSNSTAVCVLALRWLLLVTWSSYPAAFRVLHILRLLGDMDSWLTCY
jgi:hypothetical protein